MWQCVIRSTAIHPSLLCRLQGALYATFSLLATTALVTAAGAAVDWPAAAKPALALLLLAALLCWAMGAAAALLLRSGNDVCASLEPLLLSLSGKRIAVTPGTQSTLRPMGPRRSNRTIPHCPVLQATHFWRSTSCSAKAAACWACSMPRDQPAWMCMPPRQPPPRRWMLCGPPHRVGRLTCRQLCCRLWSMQRLE